MGMTETDNMEADVYIGGGSDPVPLHNISCPDQIINALLRAGAITAAEADCEWTMGDLVKWIGRETGADL